MLSKTAAIECADGKTGIRVNLVTPGGVKTPMWEKMEFFQGIVSQAGGTDQAFAAMEGSNASQKFFTAEEDRFDDSLSGIGRVIAPDRHGDCAGSRAQWVIHQKHKGR